MARRIATLTIEFEEGHEALVRAMVFPAFSAAYPVAGKPITTGLYGVTFTCSPKKNPAKDQKKKTDRESSSN